MTITEQVITSVRALDLATAAIALEVPVVRSCEIVEFGCLNTGGADAGDSDGALELFYRDGANNIVVLRTLLGTTAFDQGEILVGRTSVQLDTVADRYIVSGTVTADAQGITGVGVQIKTSNVFASSSTGQVYMIIRFNGAGGAAATGTVDITVTA